MVKQEVSELKQISPDNLIRNPDNPRMIFREDELDKLLNSIRAVGIQVPLTVYEEPAKRHFVLLDGERRWLCSKKLNLHTIPVIVQPKPSQLENILRMFNIHNVREQWDPMPSALKIKEVIRLLRKEKGEEPTPAELASLTGVSKSTINRYLSLLELPEEYQAIILEELKKPKHLQKFTEDFFLEMVKALKVMERYTPEIFEEISKKQVMKNFIAKYRNNVITNIVKFRDVSRIARSEKADVPRDKVLPIIKRLVTEPAYTIEDAYHASVQAAYEERGLKGRIDDLILKISSLKKEKHLSQEIVQGLKELRKIIDEILGRNK